MLEQISGSAELIEEYNRLLDAKQAAEDNTIFTFQKKKVQQNNSFKWLLASR
jgi:hypothetical protein